MIAVETETAAKLMRSPGKNLCLLTKCAVGKFGAPASVQMIDGVEG